MLYNGNYGKAFANQVLNVELVAAGTQFAAGSVSRSAMNTLFEANRWMVFRNTVNGRLHWDFVSLPNLSRTITKEKNLVCGREVCCPAGGRQYGQRQD